MKKHKICVIGDGLSGLVTAQKLSNLDVKIDLVSKGQIDFENDNRTTAISPSNLKFILENLPKKAEKIFYPCKKVCLYHEVTDNNISNFMNFNDNEKTIMYIAENKKLKNLFLDSLKKNKNVFFIKKKIDKINILNTSLVFKKNKRFYDLIVICTGRNNQISEKVFGSRSIQENKEDMAITCIIKHNLKICESKQYFLKEGPLALLPISESKLSLIWSMNKNFKKYSPKELEVLIIKKINHLFKNKIKFNLTPINSFPINFRFKKKIFNKNIGGIGESIYNFYPVAGQGFNLILRDIENLHKNINRNLLLGLPIKDSTILSDLSKSRKPEDLLYGIGINLTQKFFRYNNFTEPAKRAILKELDKLKFIKKIGLNIVDKGLQL